MKSGQPCRTGTQPFLLTKRHEEILTTFHFYRYMTALDVTQLLFSPASLTFVRAILSSLAGGTDYKTNQYLYRFPFPGSLGGNSRRIYTLGSKGRDFLACELGMPVSWYFRPAKVKHLSAGQVTHNLILTRFLVAAHNWSEKQPDWKLAQTRISYDLAKTPVSVRFIKGGSAETVNVTPDAWLLFDILQEGQHARWFPVLLEIDRGTEYQQKFKQHIRSRIEFIRSGAYSKIFANEAVTIAYVTTGQIPEYREKRCRTMCTWTQEVLAEMHKEDWATVFRFCSLLLDDIYQAPIFHEPLWLQPFSASPVRLFRS